MNTQELMGGDQPFPMVYRNMTYLKLETLGTLSQGPFVHAIFMFSSLPNSSIYTFFFIKNVIPLPSQSASKLTLLKLQASPN